MTDTRTQASPKVTSATFQINVWGRTFEGSRIESGFSDGSRLETRVQGAGDLTRRELIALLEKTAKGLRDMEESVLVGEKL